MVTRVQRASPQTQCGALREETTPLAKQRGSSYVKGSAISATTRTFLRHAISSAIDDFSASDNIRAAKGKTSSASTVMCCLYIDARSRAALRTSPDSGLVRLPVERYF